MPKHSPCEKIAAGCPRCLDANVFCFSPDAFGRAVPAVDSSRSSVFPVRSRGRGVRNHFKHSVELVDGEGNIVDVLAAVEDFAGPGDIRGRETAMAEGTHSAEPRDQNSRGQQP